MRKKLGNCGRFQNQRVPYVKPLHRSQTEWDCKGIVCIFGCPLRFFPVFWLYYKGKPYKHTTFCFLFFFFLFRMLRFYSSATQLCPSWISWNSYAYVIFLCPEVIQNSFVYVLWHFDNFYNYHNGFFSCEVTLHYKLILLQASMFLHI